MFIHVHSNLTPVTYRNSQKNYSTLNLKPYFCSLKGAACVLTLRNDRHQSTQMQREAILLFTQKVVFLQYLYINNGHARVDMEGGEEVMGSS